MKIVGSVIDRCWFAMFFVVMVSGVAAAGVKEEILRQYSRASEAAKLKFVDGMHSIRSPRFSLINSEGQTLNLEVERKRTEQLFSPAIAVDESVKLTGFSLRNSTTANCAVTYETTIQLPNPLTGQSERRVLVTHCNDEWTLEARGWLLFRSRVLSQEFRR